MKTIVVDDDPVMLKSFKRLSEGIDSLHIVGEFTDSEEALTFARSNEIELAVLDIQMPGMTGLELAERLRELRPDMLLVFITAYDDYIREFNQLDADYYIMKPYRRETVRQMAERMTLLSKRQQKELYIQTFGRFLVLQAGKPLPLTGKAKEILALVVTKRGREISNEEIYSTLWEDRPYGNVEMKVYYNALRRLKNALAEASVEQLLQSTRRGQTVNTELFDCDYYDWLDRDQKTQQKFTGEFMSEYSWGEYFLTDMLNRK